MAKPSKANPSLRFRFQIHPASKLKHAISALSDPDFNKRGAGLIEVGNRGFEITARNTQTGVVGYLRFKATGLINFCCANPIKNNKINLNRISQKLVDADDDDTITVHNLDGSTDLCFIFGSSPTKDFSVELIEINGELEKLPQLTCACEAVMLSKHLRETIQPEIVSLDITDNSLNIFAGKRLWRYYYDMKKGGGARGIEPGEEHRAMIRWPHHEALKKASYLSIRLVIYLVNNPPKSMILRFHLPELGDLVFIYQATRMKHH